MTGHIGTNAPKFVPPVAAQIPEVVRAVFDWQMQPDLGGNKSTIGVPGCIGRVALRELGGKRVFQNSMGSCGGKGRISSPSFPLLP